jgi:hypothetical protein
MIETKILKSMGEIPHYFISMGGRVGGKKFLLNKQGLKNPLQRL